MIFLIFYHLAPKEVFLTANDRTKLEGINFPRSIISEIIADPTKIASMSLSAAQKSEALNAYGELSLATTVLYLPYLFTSQPMICPPLLLGRKTH